MILTFPGICQCVRETKDWRRAMEQEGWKGNISKITHIK